MKNIIVKLAKENQEDYGVLLETCADIVYGQAIDYSRLNELELGLKEQLESKKNSKYLDKQDDFYLGKIIYSYNIIKDLAGDNLEQFSSLEKAYKRAINILVSYNLALPSKVASSFQHLGLDKDDLIQEGTMKLITAAEKYDYRKGFKFITYATYWVKQGMREGLHNQSKTIRKPTHVIAILNKINEAKRKLSEELKREPSNEEISIETDLSVEEISKYLVYSQDVVSFQSVNSESGEYTFENLIASSESIEDSICDDTVKDALRQAFKTLTEREVAVISLRFGLDGGEPMTLDAIGAILGVTRERVRQIESKALRNLRHPSRSKYLLDYI